MRIGWMLAAVFACVTASSAQADETADGQALVERLCSGCHATAPGVASPHPDAPPLAEVAHRYEPADLAETFAEGAMVGHSDMPEFELSADDIEALVSYLEELKKGG